MRYLTIVAALVSFIFCSCSKSSSKDNGMGIAPSNLSLTSTVAADNNGNVSFTATATNAVSYDYDFGNGFFETVATGSVTYKYPASGTYTVNVIAKNSSGLTTSKSTQVIVAITAGMALVWSDEFNTDGAPDASKWGYDIGNGGGGWGNNELEYYTNRPDNAVVSNGTLKIIAKKENYSGFAYTSARLLTKGKFNMTYGRVDVRAMLPAGLGTWPAIWMLGSNFETNPWPACGEIDIMEQRGSELNKIYGTLHYPGHSGANGNSGNTIISTATTQFHIYSLIWTAASVQILVDNQPYQTVANSASLPFNSNFFFILNFAMGGNFGGAVDPAFTSATIEIDYIRVYQ
jgi:beta-glucanase (GH16 family)